jgi:SNF2 family DNA or RNA helicase
VCEVCEQADEPELLMVCEDGLDCEGRGARHTFCLQPPLSDPPDREWHCLLCKRGALRREKAKRRTKRLNLAAKRAAAVVAGVASPGGPGSEEVVEVESDSDDDMETGAQRLRKCGKRHVAKLDAITEYLIRSTTSSFWEVRWVPEPILRYKLSRQVNKFEKRTEEVIENLAYEKGIEDYASVARHPSVELLHEAFNSPDGSLVDGIPVDSKEAERVLATKTEPSLYQPREDNVRVLVKWRLMQYDEATWMDLILLRKLGFGALYDAYLERNDLSHVLAREDSLVPRDMIRKTCRQQMEEQPPSLAFGKLHPFQLEGVNWLRYNFGQRNSVILADEMGLGKTVQVIAFICSLEPVVGRGPHLVVIPLSTAQNWMNEFERWAPHLNVI